MIRFAELLDRLVYTPQRNGKLALLGRYFRETPDPDRGHALAALTDGLGYSFPVRRVLADLVATRVDAELFRLSREYVGDTAEAVALIWPDAPADATTAGTPPPPSLAEVVATLVIADRAALPALLTGWLDRLDASGRYALIKLMTGALRVGVSARLARTALAEAFDRDLDAIEEVWHGVRPPYASLFQWLQGLGPKPDISGAPVFRPLMLAQPLEHADWQRLDLADYAVEWKWDGIRVQLAGGEGALRLYSRTGDDISASFPELCLALRFDGVLDGELLVVRDGVVAPFNDLQQRLNRKTVTRRMLADYPVHVRLYDALLLDSEDLRALPFSARRRRLEAWHARTMPPLSDLSALIETADRAGIEALWNASRESAIEGLMLKRRDGPYLAGRPKGEWFKWKRAPLTADCVLMYAQRGAGKRSSFYSNYTFGAWRQTPDGPELVPVGKAYSGFTDEELVRLDRFVRVNSTERFGPVRAVAPLLVLEVAFDAVQRSPRHKSGLALRFPRVHRIRWDKPAGEADTVEHLIQLIAVE